MDAFVLSSTIHFYDTDRHLIACGVPGFSDRSTKHERSVTCPACVSFLEDRRAARRGSAMSSADPVQGGLA